MSNTNTDIDKPKIENNTTEEEKARKKAEFQARAKINAKENLRREKERMKDIEKEDVFKCMKKDAKGKQIKLFKIKYNVLTEDEKILKDKMNIDDKKYLKTFKNLTTRSYDMKDESLYEGKLVKYNNTQVIITKVVKYKNGKTKYDIIYVTPKVIFEKGRYIKKNEEKKVDGDELKPIDIVHFIDCSIGKAEEENMKKIAEEILVINRYFDFKRNTIKLKNKQGAIIPVGKKGFESIKSELYHLHTPSDSKKDDSSETPTIQIYTIYYEIIISRKKKKDFGKIDTWEIPFFIAKNKTSNWLKKQHGNFKLNCDAKKVKLKGQWNEIAKDIPIVRKMVWGGGKTRRKTRKNKNTRKRKTRRKSKKRRYH